MEETPSPVYKRALDVGTALEFVLVKKSEAFSFLNYTHFKIKISFRNRGIPTFYPIDLGYMVLSEFNFSPFSLMSVPF